MLEKTPSMMGGGMDVFWNYTIHWGYLLDLVTLTESPGKAQSSSINVINLSNKSAFLMLSFCQLVFKFNRGFLGLYSFKNLLWTYFLSLVQWVGVG